MRKSVISLAEGMLGTASRASFYGGGLVTLTGGVHWAAGRAVTALSLGSGDFISTMGITLGMGGGTFALIGWVGMAGSLIAERLLHKKIEKASPLGKIGLGSGVKMSRTFFANEELEERFSNLEEAWASYVKGDIPQSAALAKFSREWKEKAFAGDTDGVIEMASGGRMSDLEKGPTEEWLNSRVGQWERSRWTDFIPLIEMKELKGQGKKKVTEEDVRVKAIKVLKERGLCRISIGKGATTEESLSLLEHADKVLALSGKLVGLTEMNEGMGWALELGFPCEGKRWRGTATGERRAIRVAAREGEGSLAHEWFHAFDFEIGKEMTGSLKEMGTNQESGKLSEIADELQKKCRKALEEAWKWDDIENRSYWRNKEEFTARAFEACLFQPEWEKEGYEGIFRKEGEQAPGKEEASVANKILREGLSGLGDRLKKKKPGPKI